MRHRNPGGFLYGALVTGAVLAVSSASDDRAATVLRAVVQVLIVYWCAHVYVRVLTHGRGGTSAGLGERTRSSLLHELAILEGGLPAISVFSLGALLGMETGRAADLALFATIVFLAVAGYIVGREAKVEGWSLIAEVVAAVDIGVLVVGLKA